MPIEQSKERHLAGARLAGTESHLEALRGAHMETVASQELSEKDKKDMLAISAANWLEIPTMLPYIQKGLENKLKAPAEETQFRVLRKDDRIVAFMRFDMQSADQWYWGSFNVSPELRGLGIGEAMMHAALDAEASRRTLVANVHPDSIVGSSYVEKFGFVIVDVEDVDFSDGKRDWGFIIKRDDRVNSKYQARKTKIVLDVSEKREAYEPAYHVRVYRYPEDKERIRRDVQTAALDGEVVSRYIIGPDQSRILAFEPALSEEDVEEKAERKAL